MPLPGLNTDDPTVTVIGISLDWPHKLVHDYDVDGLRIDTVKHIRKDLWPDFKGGRRLYARRGTHQRHRLCFSVYG